MEPKRQLLESVVQILRTILDPRICQRSERQLILLNIKRIFGYRPFGASENFLDMFPRAGARG